MVGRAGSHSCQAGGEVELFQRGAHQQVDDQPVVEVAQVGDGGADPRPDQAAGAIRADNVLGGDRPPFVGGRLELQCDPVRVFEVGYRLPAAQHLNRVERLDLRVQDRLQAWLVEEVAHMPARRAQPAPVQLQQRLPVSSPPLVQVVIRANHVGHRIRGYSDRLENPADLVVEVDRPRQRIRAGLALHHDHPLTALAEQQGQHAAHRPVADHGNVRVQALYWLAVHPRHHAFLVRVTPVTGASDATRGLSQRRDDSRTATATSRTRSRDTAA